MEEDCIEEVETGGMGRGPGQRGERENCDQAALLIITSGTSQEQGSLASPNHYTQRAVHLHFFRPRAPSTSRMVSTFVSRISRSFTGYNSPLGIMFSSVTALFWPHCCVNKWQTDWANPLFFCLIHRKQLDKTICTSNFYQTLLKSKKLHTTFG